MPTSYYTEKKMHDNSVAKLIAKKLWKEFHESNIIRKKLSGETFEKKIVGTRNRTLIEKVFC